MGMHFILILNATKSVRSEVRDVKKLGLYMLVLLMEVMITIVNFFFFRYKYE